MPGLTANSTPGQITRWVLTALIAGVLLFGIWEVRNTLLLVLASVILVVLFTMPIRFLVRRGVGRSLATLMSLVGMIAFILLLAMLALPSILQQFATLAVDVQDGIQEAVSQWDNIQNAPPDSELRHAVQWYCQPPGFSPNDLSTQQLE